ncbi:MAG TPA: hypothetical protein VKS81_04655, partial [Bacteroidota bacterium]|nr:hypothetical protein [Bacteroidota bacterium]
MKFDRRGFLKTAGGLAIATAASSLPTFAATEDASGKASGRIAVLYDPSFPPGEIKLLPHDEIAKALEQYHTSFITANELASALDPAKFDLFINPYGSLFPEEAAESIFTFLRAGGNWINLGGTPLSIPIIRTGGGWEKQNLQTAFYKKLGITQTFRISQAGVTSYEENDQAMMFGGIIHQFNATETYSFYYRFTNTKDFPDEDGSDGPREATLTPMVWGCNDAGIRLTAPFVQIDRISGDYVGGRWIFASFSGEITPRLLSWLKETALHGATEFVLAPSFASYISGELPQISVQIRKPGRSITGAVDGECKVSISYGPAFPNVKQSGAGEMVIPMATKGDVALGSAIARSAKPFVPSHYEVEATIFVKSPITQSGTMLVRRTGFWVMDQTLLTNGKPLT